MDGPKLLLLLLDAVRDDHGFLIAAMIDQDNKFKSTFTMYPPFLSRLICSTRRTSRYIHSCHLGQEGYTLTSSSIYPSKTDLLL